LVNSLDTVKWNINTRYLKELEQKGVEIVPTHWVESFDFNAVLGYFSLFKTKQIVIKPTISANAENTFWLKQDTFNLEKKQLKKSLEGRQLMIQPFIPAVVEEGEYSVFYFSGAFSHCILKTPKEGDFRVQEEYGSTLSKVQPSEALLSASEKALNAIPEKVLYARIDLVEFKKSFKVMELELIEPSLYFNLDEKSPIRFAVAFDEWMK
jgi:glutathione synthase/RimK-type ligase-like ATP-grasp enzyme